jgi:hypothetical protein
MEWEEEARQADEEIKAVIKAFNAGKDVSEMLKRINVDERVNTWMYCFQPFQMIPNYSFLIPIVEYFHYHEDLLDYHDRDFYPGDTDANKVNTVNGMSPSKDMYESFTCIERCEIDEATLSVKVDSHGMNGLFFHNLCIFKSEAGLIEHYKSLIYDIPRTCLTPVEGYFLSDGEKIISHSDAELVKFYDRYITPRLSK